jgi:hypothetical protein
MRRKEKRAQRRHEKSLRGAFRGISASKGMKKQKKQKEEPYRFICFSFLLLFEMFA